MMLFGSSAMPAPQELPDYEANREAEEAARRRRVAERLKKGRASTILTGGQGLLSEAPTRKTILGA